MKKLLDDDYLKNADLRRGNKFHALAQNIAKSIANGEYHDRLPSVKELCEKHQVTLVTMDKALKLLKANGMITVRHARGIFVSRLQRPKTGRILFLGNTIDFAKAPVHAEFISGMRKECIAQGLQLLIEHHDSSPAKELKVVVDYWDKEQVDGIVLWETNSRQAKARNYLHENNVPFVLAPELTNLPCDDFNRVTVNEPSQLNDAVNELVALGHQKIGFIRQTRWRNSPHFSEARMESFHDSLNQHGLKAAAILELSMEETKEMVLAPKDVKRLRQLTALVCETEHTAGLICKLCLHEGIRIPGDLSLVCYDNSNLSNVLGITTMDPQLGKLGALAVRMLTHEMQGKLTQTESWTVQPKLIVRSSTAKPRED